MTLKALVETSQLQQEDKNLWFSILENLDEAQIKIFEDFIGDKEENLKELTDNLKAKRKALEELNGKALEKILTSEQ
ncbi:MAG: hypothetical protein HYX20_04125 [Candidatus Yanofskybacteria bacterium]|nr:hypothetical protein [Candidatus Yanofskybacteria bacterium]